MVSGKDKSGKSAAHYCAENQNLNCIEQIIAADPGLLNEVDEEGYAPLHLAVISGNSLIVKFLISKGADVNALDNEKHSTVHWATGKFCLKYHELKTTVRPMVKTVGLGKLGDKLYRSSKEIPKIQSETIAAPAMQSPLGIWCMTMIWNKNAKIISKARSTDTEVGETIFKAAVMAKIARIPIKDIMDKIAQSKTSKCSIVSRIFSDW